MLQVQSEFCSIGIKELFTESFRNTTSPLNPISKTKTQPFYRKLWNQ